MTTDPTATTNPTPTTTDRSQALVECALDVFGAALEHLHRSALTAKGLLGQVPPTSPDHERAVELAAKLAAVLEHLNTRQLDQIKNSGNRS